MSYTYAEIAKMIDHSLLQPVLTAAELESGSGSPCGMMSRASALCLATFGAARSC